jgi:hypothetical protein
LARVHAAKSGDDALHEYFLASTGTHDDVLDAIQNHIINHPKLPHGLAEHVPEYIHHIESGEDRKVHTIQQYGAMLAPRGPDGPQADIGAHTAKKHSHPDTEVLGVHPHMQDDTHHLKGVIEEIQDNPSDGYFLKKDEYK